MTVNSAIVVLVAVFSLYGKQMTAGISVGW